MASPQQDGDKKFHQSVSDVLKARAAIITREGKRRGVSDWMPCPVCSGDGNGAKLSYRIAHNGHIHAACSNDTCVRWME